MRDDGDWQDFLDNMEEDPEDPLELERLEALEKRKRQEDRLEQEKAEQKRMRKHWAMLETGEDFDTDAVWQPEIAPIISEKPSKQEKLPEFNIGKISHPDLLKGYAFEFLVSLWYQKMRGPEAIIPQARLARGTSNSVYVDIYNHNPRQRDGELIEARWKDDRKGLDSLVKKVLNAASDYHNCGYNTGKHVNIDTERDRKLTIVVHTKIDYSNPKAEYVTLEDLGAEWPYRAVDQMIEHHSRDTWKLKRMARALYSLLVQGFEQNRVMDIEQYVTEHLKKGDLNPYNIDRFLWDRGFVSFGVVQGDPNRKPRRAVPIKFLEVDGKKESRLLYYKRYYYGE